MDRGEAAAEREVDLDHIRPDLAEIVERHALGLDAARPEAVARRRKTGQRTARENVDDFCDPGSFVEYGPMVIAAQRQRRSLDDLVRRTPAGRPDRRCGPRERRPVRRPCRAVHRHVVRLHGVGRHAGVQEPLQERPPVRVGGAVEAAGRVLRRGRRRTPGRYGLVEPVGTGRSRVLFVGQAVGHGAAGRHHVGPVFCGQRGHPGLLRRHHCDRRFQHRHGRPGHDRGRRPGRLPARRRGADGRAGAQRRGRYPGRGRGRGGPRGEAVPVLFPGAGRRLGMRRPAACCAASSRRTACACTKCAT